MQIHSVCLCDQNLFKFSWCSACCLRAASISSSPLVCFKSFAQTATALSIVSTVFAPVPPGLLAFALTSGRQLSIPFYRSLISVRSLRCQFQQEKMVCRAPQYYWTKFCSSAVLIVYAFIYMVSYAWASLALPGLVRANRRLSVVYRYHCKCLRAGAHMVLDE